VPFQSEVGEDGFGFLAGEAGDVGDGVFVEEGVFRDVGGMDSKGEAGLGEEFAAAWGCGGEDEVHDSIIADWGMGG
jgi:hypothetical protein